MVQFILINIKIYSYEEKELFFWNFIFSETKKYYRQPLFIDIFLKMVGTSFASLLSMESISILWAVYNVG